MADDAEEDKVRIKMKSLEIDEAVQGKPNKDTSESKSYSGTTIPVPTVDTSFDVVPKSLSAKSPREKVRIKKKSLEVDEALQRNLNKDTSQSKSYLERGKKIPQPVEEGLYRKTTMDLKSYDYDGRTREIRDNQYDVDSGISLEEGNTTTMRMAGAKQITTVVKYDMEAFMSLEDIFVKAYPYEKASWRLLHIVAAKGTTEMVGCMKRWTRIDWDTQYVVDEDLYINAKRATPLYVATFLNKIEIVKSLLKLAGEDNIRLCLKELQTRDEIEQVYMLELADRLRCKHAELQPTVIPGHQQDDKGTRLRVFIVYSASVIQAEDYDFNGMGRVKLRNPFLIKRTKTNASDSEMDLTSNKDAKRIKKAIQTHGERLWEKHSNLNIITGRKLKVKRNQSDIEEACVVLYCSTKGVIPLGEDNFPKRLWTKYGYISVVVREGFFDLGGYSTDSSTRHHLTLKMGCEIGRLTPKFDARGKNVRNCSGTLGPFLRFNSSLGFLTCSHVLFDIPSHSYYLDCTASFSMIHVSQPSTDSRASVNNTCGTVERAVFNPANNISIDAAVVKITEPSRAPSAGQFSNERHSSYENAGFNELPEYNNGSMLTTAEINALPSKPNVVKFGSRTDVTKGAFSVVGANVRAYSKALGFGSNAGKILMENQYLVTGIHPSTDFFDGGDSGSAVFCQDSNGQLVCVGMAIGHCVLDDYQHKAGIVTPIDAILQALGSTFTLATFS